jgi:DNA-nicking Smr family endonuclease
MLPGSGDARIVALTRRFPGIADLVDLLLAHHGDDVDAAFAALCDMVAEASSGDEKAADKAGDADDVDDEAVAAGAAQHREASLPSWISTGDAELDLYAEAFSQMDIQSDAELAWRVQDDSRSIVSAVASPACGRWAAPNASGGNGGSGGGRSSGGLGGGDSWNGGNPAARLTYAGRACVDRIMCKYPWADRAVVVRCYEASGEDEALAEELLVAACPDVVSVAHDASTSGHPSQRRTRRAASALVATTVAATDTSRSRVAEQLRQRDVEELAAARARRLADDGVDETARLRRALNAAAEQRDSYKALYLRTRRKEHERQALQHAAEADRIWSELLAWMLRADSGSLDLHFLTADQALEAVEAKLAQVYGRQGRLRIITGRGNNSANGAVLRPRIQRLLTAKGITHALDQTGGVVIAKLTR